MMDKIIQTDFMQYKATRLTMAAWAAAETDPIYPDRSREPIGRVDHRRHYYIDYIDNLL